VRILTFSMISAAFLLEQMPWIYWSALRTRLLGGLFTPAYGHGLLEWEKNAELFRRIDIKPHPGSLLEAAVFCYLGRFILLVCYYDARALGCPGGPESLKTSDWIRVLLRRLQLGFVNLR